MRHQVFPTRSSVEIPRPVIPAKDGVTAGVRAARRGACRALSFDEDSRSAVFDVMPTTLLVLRMAREVETDPVALASWYRDTRIAELGDLTAAQLVSLGRADDVIMFLCAVRNGQRG